MCFYTKLFLFQKTKTKGSLVYLFTTQPDNLKLFEQVVQTAIIATAIRFHAVHSSNSFSTEQQSKVKLATLLRSNNSSRNSSLWPLRLVFFVFFPPMQKLKMIHWRRNGKHIALPVTGFWCHPMFLHLKASMWSSCRKSEVCISSNWYVPRGVFL